MAKLTATQAAVFKAFGTGGGRFTLARDNRVTDSSEVGAIELGFREDLKAAKNLREVRALLEGAKEALAAVEYSSSASPSELDDKPEDLQRAMMADLEYEAKCRSDQLSKPGTALARMQSAFQAAEAHIAKSK